ncbi:MAG: hypothetical protein HYZ65_10815 [Burkholderiales bacterium]|nr:hypothetical protein [Burkholderiales bacterium]
MHFLKKVSVLVLLAAGTTLAQANDCPSCGISNASEAMSQGGGIVVLGSISLAAASGTLVVQSVEAVADGVTVVLKGSADAASVTVKLSAQALQKTALVSGTVLQATAVATGYLLVAAGKAIAFIPNEAGQALLHHARAK